MIEGRVDSPTVLDQLEDLCKSIIIDGVMNIPHTEPILEVSFLRALQLIIQERE